MNEDTPFYENQVRIFWVVFAIVALALYSCVRSSDDFFIIPPPTYPLSRPIIGYGVIVSSYTNLSSEPRQDGLSQGYMRRGSLVHVIERRAINKQGTIESWVLVEAGYRGWLREEEMDIYDYEEQARTAAEAMNQ
jgi:hypothetical protein